jgi:membrane associated rhomboid family serine protease
MKPTTAHVTLATALMGAHGVVLLKLYDRIQPTLVPEQTLALAVVASAAVIGLLMASLMLAESGREGFSDDRYGRFAVACSIALALIGFVWLGPLFFQAFVQLMPPR